MAKKPKVRFGRNRQDQTAAEEPRLEWIRAETGQFNESLLSPALILHFANAGEGAKGEGTWNIGEGWPTGRSPIPPSGAEFIISMV